ncbi:hypothetical protein [Mesorhizobium erdmanii]|uniref:hypothetical protein n=1 Tax=Mesorhizobium erdmanii TaxID=1777866 RepID=UPI000A4E6EC3|nr:hypothetical protein [Mesorhizobium erdmanii]
MRFAIALGALLIFGSHSYATEFGLMGEGTSTCAEILQLHPAFGNDGGAVVLAWAQGYMSGMNMDRVVNKAHKIAQGQPIKSLGDVTIQGQMAFLLNYCENHPLAHFTLAVQELYVALPDVKALKN